MLSEILCCACDVQYNECIDRQKIDVKISKIYK